MLQLTFQQTRSEQMVRAAASLLFFELARHNVPEVTIADLAEQPQYGFTASAVSHPIGPKLVRITDLQDGKIEWDRVPFCECPEEGRFALRDHDILFARTGATTGKTHLVRQPEDAVFASYLIRLRPNLMSSRDIYILSFNLTNIGPRSPKKKRDLLNQTSMEKSFHVCEYRHFPGRCRLLLPNSSVVSVCVKMDR
jgi:type I restriction enzyme, S subunit